MPSGRHVPGRTCRPVNTRDAIPRIYWVFARHFTCLVTGETKTMKSPTLQYYMHDGPSAFRFELAGNLNNEAARDLDQAWHTASAVIGERALVVDMTFVTGAEGDGRSLLARWYAEGAQLIARSKVSRALAEAILGEPLPEFAAAASAGSGRT